MIKENINEDIFIVCKEMNFDNNEIIVYDVGFLIENNISPRVLQLRETYNPRLKYYAILKSNLDSKDYIKGLIKKEISSILYTYV